MKPFPKCPVCGGGMTSKRVEKLLRGGHHTAVLHARAEVCLKCGERLYTPSAVRKFERIRARLAENNLKGFSILGKTVEAR